MDGFRCLASQERGSGQQTWLTDHITLPCLGFSHFVLKITELLLGNLDIPE